MERSRHPELDHDFLWRTHRALPERGKVGIFNRSYNEEARTADDKKNVRLIVSQIVLVTLKRLPLTYPQTTKARVEPLKLVRQSREED